MLTADDSIPEQKMPADGRIELIFSFGDGSRRVASDGSDDCAVESSSFLLGVRTQGYHLTHAGTARYVAVRFKTGGLSAFTRLPIAELTDLYVDLNHLWNPLTVRRLESQLDSARAPHQQIQLLDTALLAHLNPPDHLERLLYATQHMDTLSMPRLADAINLSQKHFERLFARHIGLRPNLYHRIARFQRVMQTILTPTPHALSQLALNAGYYDQAHFNKDFKRFSGSAPQHFFTAAHDFIQLKQVEILQDRAS